MVLAQQHSVPQAAPARQAASHPSGRSASLFILADDNVHAVQIACYCTLPPALPSPAELILGVRQSESGSTCSRRQPPGAPAPRPECRPLPARSSRPAATAAAATRR